MNWAESVFGNDLKVPIKNGELARYINFDNAASTPAFKVVVRDVTDFVGWYSNVHRGEGYKSRLTTDIYEKSREQIAEFVGADSKNNTVIFVKNTTEAINKLANHISFKEKNIVLSTYMEHHSNDLPWRNKGKVVYAKTLPDGTLDYEHVEYLCNKHAGKIRLFAVTGASNVTGVVNDIGFLAELAHRHGAEIMVDAAQLIPHKKINMLADDHPAHIDYLAFSAHKMYAPFGVGVLIGKKSVFKKTAPDYVGGGTVSSVTHDRVYWADLPHKEEAGTPNVMGVVALLSAVRQLEEITMQKVDEHERKLSEYFIKKISHIPEIKFFGPKSSKGRVGVFSFAVKEFEHALVATRLSQERAIGVRNGCFCAHPYVLRLLGISNKKAHKYQKRIKKGYRQGIPGLIRLSFGLYNTVEEVDYFIDSIRSIINTPELNNNYTEDPKTGIYFSNYAL